MISSKYTSLIFKNILDNRYITYQGTRLKTAYLFNIIDLFLYRYQFFNKDNIKLNSRILKSLYTSKYTKYIEYLIDNNFIFLYKNYSVGYKAKTYKLTELAKETRITNINVELSNKLISKIKTFNTSINSIDDWIKQKLIRDLYEVKIDIDGAKDWLDNNIDKEDKAYNINLITATKIHNKDFHYSFDQYGRFHTNYTVLKKELRNNFLKFGEYNIRELDITNSQPFFLYILMRDAGFKKFDGFDEDVLSGSIYEKLSSISNKSRKEVKVNVYSVLFGRNMTKDYWNELFGELYPNVYNWIKEYKKINKSYKIIARELQGIESDFIFNNLIPNVLLYNKNLPIITIHDSIIIPEYAYDDVKQIFKSTKLDLINKELKLKLIS